MATQGRATVHWQTFDPKRLVYSTQATTNRNKGKMVRVEYLDPSTGEHVPLRWQSPRLKIPFGVSQYPPAGSETANQLIKYSLPQNLTDDAYRVFLEKVDNRNIQAVLEHQDQWFPGKPGKTEEILRHSYVPIVKPTPEGKDYPPTSRFKVPFRMKQIDTRFWNEQRQQIASGDVAPQSEAVTVNEIPALWFIQAQWGAQGQVNQVKVYSASDRYDGYGIDDDEPMAEECPVDDA